MNEIWGFKLLSEPVFSKVSDFVNGYAIVETTDYLFSNKKHTFREYAKEIIVSKYYLSHNNVTFPFDNTPLNTIPLYNIQNDPVLLKPFSCNGLYGYCDLDGNTVVNPVFNLASDFINGFAKVAFSAVSGKETFYKYGIINNLGKNVFSPSFVNIGGIFNNIFWFRYNLFVDYMYNGMCGYSQKTYMLPRFGYFIYSKINDEDVVIQSKLIELSDKYSNANSEYERLEIDNLIKFYKTYLKAIQGVLNQYDASSVSL